MPDLNLSVTTTALLDALFEREDHATWLAFDRRFRPILLGVARGLGLEQEEAADVAQETLVQVVQGYRAGGYARERGRLRTWILAILKHRAIDTRRRRGTVRFEDADQVLDARGEERLEELWETEYRRKLLTDAVELLRASKQAVAGEVDLFVAHALEDRATREVADAYDVSLWAVYRATKKCTDLLRRIVEQLEQAYEAS